MNKNLDPTLDRVPMGWQANQSRVVIKWLERGHVNIYTQYIWNSGMPLFAKKSTKTTKIKLQKSVLPTQISKGKKWTIKAQQSNKFCHDWSWRSQLLSSYQTLTTDINFDEKVWVQVQEAFLEKLTFMTVNSNSRQSLLMLNLNVSYFELSKSKKMHNLCSCAPVIPCLLPRLIICDVLFLSCVRTPVY